MAGTWRTVPVALILMLVAACEAEPPEKTVWDEQLQSIDKAREMEQQILDATKQKNREIERQTQQ